MYPFEWQLMEDEVAEVVAAKDGFILGKYDNNYDKQCDFCTACEWNAVYIFHNDNTISLYGHLKTGTLTTLKELSDVTQGEYLGKVGSSGNSTGPHLHFEVLDINDSVLDPFYGDCNLSITESLWENQRPHKLPMINAIKTSSKPALFASCPDDPEDSFEKKIFQPGDNLVVTAYLTDQKKSTNLNLKIINPLGTQVANFNKFLTDDFNSSYWYWSLAFNANAISGEYLLKGTYLNQIVNYKFEVSSPSSISEPSVKNQWMNYQNYFLSVNLNFEEKAIIYDITGKKILDFNITNSSDLSSLPSGFYFISLLKNGVILDSQKLFIQ